MLIKSSPYIIKIKYLLGEMGKFSQSLIFVKFFNSQKNIDGFIIHSDESFNLIELNFEAN